MATSRVSRAAISTLRAIRYRSWIPGVSRSAVELQSASSQSGCFISRASDELFKVSGASDGVPRSSFASGFSFSRGLLHWCKSGIGFLTKCPVTDHDSADIPLPNHRQTGVPLSNHQQTGVPLPNLQQFDKKKLLCMEQVLQRRIVGQNVAIKCVTNAIKRSKVGLSDPNRPIASFIFMGPTGVGKTELAKALAGYLFDTEDALMQVSGYEEGGQLIEIVRRKPNCVILFEDIEKANDHIFDILFRILNDGRIIDSQGKTVSFTNTVVITSSNLGSDYNLEALLSSGESKEIVYEDMKRQVIEKATGTLSPRFLNRLDEHIVFQALDFEEISSIVELKMNQVKDRLKKEKIDLNFTEQAVKLLAELSYYPNYGARPVKWVIDQLVLTEIAYKILDKETEEEDSVIIDAADTSSAATNLSSSERLTIKKM